MKNILPNFRVPDAKAIAAQDLAECRRQLLQAEANLENAQAARDVYVKRIARLAKFLEEA